MCDQWLGSNGYAGMKALRRAGWAVQVVPEWEFVPLHWRSAEMRALGRAIRSRAAREFNAELARQARRAGAEILLVFKGSFVDGRTVRSLRDAGVRCYCFFPDVSFRVHGAYIPAALPEYDWVFTSKSFGVPDLHEQLGVTHASVLLHGYDADLHRPVELNATDIARYACDVSFIGTWSPKKEALLSELCTRRPALAVRVWGEQWGAARRGALARAIGGHEVAGEEYVRALVASRINLAILSEQRAGASSGDQITSRTFHIPACGGFMLHERTDEVLALFEEGRDIACYRDADEMIARIDHYLAADDERRAIALAGHDTVTAAHSWDHRVREILSRHAASAA
ncbi:MAG: glycosyltransferase [Gemmatimonadaceae bacterium]